MRSSSCRAAIGLLMAPVILIGQSPQDRPTFRAGVRVIEVVVHVTDRDGNAVRGLTRDDFTILEDDKAQTISAFSFVDLPIEPRASREAAARAAAPDVSTNTGEGRIYVMLVSVFAEQEPEVIRRVARRFIEESMGANDQMAVIPVLDVASKAQGFTTNRALLLAAVNRIDQSPAPVPPDVVTRLSFQVLEDVAQRLGQMSGRRKAVLWFNPPTFFQPDVTADWQGVSQWFWQRDALRAAVRNHVAIYTVGEGLGTKLGPGSLTGLAAMRAMAEETGGDAIVNTNNFSPGFERFVRDNSTYYVLGYVPAIEYRDGKFHNLTVRVNRPDVTVRARRGYYAPDPDSKETVPAPVVEGLSADAVEAVRLPLSGGGLGVDLFAAPFRGTGSNGSVLLGAQVRGADLALGPGERIEIAYQAMTTEGKLTPGAFKVFTLDFTAESRAGIERDGVRFIDRLELPRGRHQVRFAVHQPNGKTGTVVADVEIPNYSAPLTMSGLVIASQNMSGQRTLLSDSDVKSILSAEPTPARTFGRRDVITAFAEVYLDLRSGGDDYRVMATLTASSGAKARAPMLSVVRNTRPEPGRIRYLIRIGTADLSPGDYVLTLEASVSRNKVMRRVPFTVAAE